MCSKCNIENCPAGVININKEIHNGIGTIFSNMCFVIPYYDDDVAINDIKEIYSKITGKSFNENCFITFAVKCNIRSQYKIFDNAVNYCRNNYNNEWIKFCPKYTFVFGNAYKLYFRYKPNNKIIPFVTPAKQHYLYFYSSLSIRHYDNVKYESIKSELTKDIYNIIISENGK